MSLDGWFERAFGDTEPGRPGTGWISGVLSVFLGVLGVGAVLCLHFPALLTSPELRAVYPMPLIRGLIEAGILIGFAGGFLSSLLRRRKVLGLTGMTLAILALLMGGAQVAVEEPVARSPYFGLDWFVLSLFVTALLFVPLERLWPLRSGQSVFRRGWTTDTLYFVASHGLIQVLSLLILLPATVLGRWLAVPALQAFVQSWPQLLQFLAVLLIADLTQYAVHRAFHEVPLLWRFHRVHHSSEALDWLAGSRLHLVDVVVTRGLVLVPVAILGFAQGAVYAYLVFVSVHAVFIHANFALPAGWLEHVLVMPRFHHWHHAAAAEAVNRNYAVHLPWLDRLFGTLCFPEAAWPSAYGLAREKPPERFLAQFAWPFRADRA
jgi:lathosterol oxidase